MPITQGAQGAADFLFPEFSFSSSPCVSVSFYAVTRNRGWWKALWVVALGKGSSTCSFHCPVIRGSTSLTRQPPDFSKWSSIFGRSCCSVETIFLDSTRTPVLLAASEEIRGGPGFPKVSLQASAYSEVCYSLDSLPHLSGHLPVCHPQRTNILSPVRVRVQNGCLAVQDGLSVTQRT